MTERLTVRGATTQRDIDRLLELSNDNQFGRNEAYYKLQHYEDLEEQGRLIELPCKVGDTVYVVYSPNRLVEPYTFKPIKIESLTKLASYIEKNAFGKTIFLTREEAEAALKGGIQ